VIDVHLQRNRQPLGLPYWEARISYSIPTGRGLSRGGCFVTRPRLFKWRAKRDAVIEAQKLENEHLSAKFEDLAFVHHAATGGDLFDPEHQERLTSELDEAAGLL
jgi:hypothetical protein